MKRPMFVSILTSILAIWSFISCDKSDDNASSIDPKFSWEESASNPNEIIFKNLSEGDYLYVEWDFGNGKTISKTTDKLQEPSVHYPVKGEYSVTLTLWGQTNQASDTKTTIQTITILNDDENYEPIEGLIWSDEFDGSSVNMNNWKFETGDGGWGNQELQNYTNGDNAHIEDGKLIITAKKVNDNQVAGSYTSTRMVTWGKQEFTCGRIEIRAKLPSGRGMWPAIWMLGSNIGDAGWPACGEIDIMEYVGFEPNQVHGSIHCPASYGATEFTKTLPLENCEEEFNNYGIIWTEESIQYYVNDPENPFYTYAPSNKNADNWPFNKPHFIILNAAVGGTWGGAQGIDNSIFPQTMEVDYVRVYEL
ncbi:family 16 glycosylhydrolase [Saccharicrinis aurantiacus]|uniref:family 16 glycosylhydrolase n=1 Tax=Saccharicrinis aurantiacus TaxID=1849719 RepID=UPI0011152FB9|nr:family 16 glycosylhydrolase [Saccharicrinis aurantiacus]